MKNRIKIVMVGLLALIVHLQGTAQESKYKCMLQMTNYDGL
jgi:hypothetical protein